MSIHYDRIQFLEELVNKFNSKAMLVMKPEVVIIRWASYPDFPDEPILFFPQDLHNYDRICYSASGDHGEASISFYDSTKAHPMTSESMDKTRQFMDWYSLYLCKLGIEFGPLQLAHKLTKHNYSIYSSD